MLIGRKIYYGVSNGLVICDTGERAGDVRETTFEEDMNVIPLLSMIPSEEIGICQLQYGELSNEFETCNAYRINPETNRPEFIIVE
jgi:hypothetical protein